MALECIECVLNVFVSRYCRSRLLQASNSLFKVHEFEEDLSTYPYNPSRTGMYKCHVRDVIGACVQLLFESRSSGNKT